MTPSHNRITHSSMRLVMWRPGRRNVYQVMKEAGCGFGGLWYQVSKSSPLMATLEKHFQQTFVFFAKRKSVESGGGIKK